MDKLSLNQLEYEFMAEKFTINMTSGDENISDCPKCVEGKGENKLYWNGKTYLFQCKVCNYSGNVFDAGYKTPNNNPKTTFTPLMKAVKAYQITGKDHRLSANVIDHFKISLNTYVSKEKGSKYEALTLSNESSQPVKRLNYGTWQAMDRRDLTGEYWLNVNNLKKGENTIYVNAGEWDLFSFWENTGIDGVSLLFGENPSNKMGNSLGFMKGKDIVIIYDYDNTGIAGAQKLARIIMNNVQTKSIKIIDPIELHGNQAIEGSDIDDFFHNGGTKDRLFEVISNTEYFYKSKNLNDYSELLSEVPEREIPLPTGDYGMDEQLTEYLWRAGKLLGTKRAVTISNLVEIYENMGFDFKSNFFEKILLQMEANSQNEETQRYLENKAHQTIWWQLA